MNFVTEKIKTPIKECLKADEMFNKTFFSFDSLVKVREIVFNMNKSFIGINIENTPETVFNGICDAVKIKSDLVIAYHCKPDLNTSEDELNEYGLNILSLIEKSLDKQKLFDDKNIQLSNGRMTVGRMWDNADLDKADVISDAAVVEYDLEYDF